MINKRIIIISVIHSTSRSFLNSVAVATTTSNLKLGPYDTIVLSLGSMSEEVPEGVEGIGDCVTPRSWWAAVTEGYRLGCKI